jgi:adenylate cyclase
MADVNGGRPTYRFGDWLIEADLGRVRRNGRHHHLEPKVLDVLIVLLRQPGEIATQEQIVESVWPGRIVEPAAVAKNIAQIRSALGDDSRHPHYIETIPKRGYRAIAQVRQVDRYSASQEPPGIATEKPLPLPDKPSIAVLSFDNMSGDPEQDYFADGIAEAITAALSRIRSFFVIARNSAFTYKGRSVNVLDIGRTLGVAYVLEGSVQRAGQRLRITVQLVETDSGVNVWAERYNGMIDDIFDLQDQITEQVAGALQPSIRIAEIERAGRKRPQDLGTYDYTMRAMPHVWSLEKKENARALTLLDKALSIDSNYPLALSLAAWCHAQYSVYNWGGNVPNRRAQALEFAERSAELSADDPLILAVLGAVQTIIRNYGTARVLLERAVLLDPNAAWAWSRLGWLETYSDNPEKALENFEHALRLSPLDPMNFNNYVGMASAYDVAQKHEEAVTLYRRALDERPHADWIYRQLTASLVGAGRIEEAQAAYTHLMECYPDLTIKKLMDAMVFSRTSLERIAANLKSLGLPD